MRLFGGVRIGHRVWLGVGIPSGAFRAVIVVAGLLILLGLLRPWN